MKAEIDKRKAVIEARATDVARWSDPSQLEPSWQARSKLASQFIQIGSRVLDVGCGAMALERFLPLGCHYQPCDVVARDDRTIVCNLNDEPLPENVLRECDLVTLLGVLEYLYEPEKLLKQLVMAGKNLLLSYCAMDWSERLDRRALGWVNDLSLADIHKMALDAGFRVQRVERIDEFQALFVLKPDSLIVNKPKRVLVLSYANVGNFGDRLGVSLLHSVLPPHAVVTHANFNPWTVPEGDFDLLVLGIGNSLFAPLLTEKLLSLLDRIPRKIGIFGTQYRNGFTPTQLHAVIDRLDIWLARYEEDVLLYGRGRSNVKHFGDWLIEAFPLVDASNKQLLTIGNEILQNQPLDRVIQNIQQHQQVMSTRLHPLLCALCSATMVSFREQRESGTNEVSGKFRSMLLDVFGRNFPEEVFWQVDRSAVLAYKTRVSANVNQLRKTLEQWLL